MPVSEVKANPRLQRAAEQASKYCHGTGEVEYHGVKFVVTFCRDWSAVSVVDKPELAAPWPVPDLNLLQNFHFDQGLANWKRTESGNVLQLSLKTSTAAKDMQYVQRGGAGIRYLAITCASDCVASQCDLSGCPDYRQDNQRAVYRGCEGAHRRRRRCLAAGGYRARPQRQGSGREIV